LYTAMRIPWTLAAVCRVPCRSSISQPLRRPTARVPKVHPATGLPISRAKGQHILHNKGVLDKIVKAADVRSYDKVLELGCGTGEITLRLLPHVREVHALDIEQRMVEETENRATSAGLSNLTLQVGDVLKCELPQRFDLCVGHLPYQISAKVIFRLLRRLSQGPAWRACVLMLQKEFAERLLADPGEKDYARISVNVRLFAIAERYCDVRPGSFQPIPTVHSTVVRLRPRWPPPQVDFDEWDGLIRVIFSRRRKTLRAQFKKITTTSMLEHNYKMRNSLTGSKPANCPFPQLLMSVLEEEGVTDQRAYCMEVEDLEQLLRAFNRKGIYFNRVLTDPQEAELLQQVKTSGFELNPMAASRDQRLLAERPPALEANSSDHLQVASTTDEREPWNHMRYP